MTLHAPFSISSRLLPSLSIGGACVQLEYSRRPGDNGRTRYKWTIDLPLDEYAPGDGDGGAYVGEDLQSGCCGGSLLEGFASLLSFLGAAADSYVYRMGQRWPLPGEEGYDSDDCDDNSSLFPPEVVRWAYAVGGDEFAVLECELEDSEPQAMEE